MHVRRVALLITVVLSSCVAWSYCLAKNSNDGQAKALSFDVADEGNNPLSTGYTYAYKSSNLAVNEITDTGWEAVLYPNSATLHCIVTVYVVSCELNDMVGAFVGSECRSVSDVVLNGANAYVTLVVNLATDGEEISFKIYDYSANLTYDALETYTLGYNDVIGSTETPVPISVSEITELDTPVITAITKIAGGFQITWNAVDNADTYEVWRATDPYGTYEQVGFNINALLFDDQTELPIAFYYMKAVKN